MKPWSHFFLLGVLLLPSFSLAQDKLASHKEFSSKLAAASQRDPSMDKKAVAELYQELRKEHPVYYDWWLQDGNNSIEWYKNTFQSELEKRIGKVACELGHSLVIGTPKNMETYISLCTERRAKRLAEFTQSNPSIVFTRFKPWRPSFFAYTEGVSDARHECNFNPGGSLVLGRMEGIWGHPETLMDDDKGTFRDPDVHFDGQKILFSWKKSAKDDDYHLYEKNLKTGALKQFTSGLGRADIEGIYLPDGNILFNSTRSGQSVDCWYTEVSNLHLCDAQGKYIRQVGFDQVHTTAPTLLDDGKVVYTRWDYNDRGQLYVQPLFQMFPDGTGQTAYYGFNSWFPTTIVHTRGIPGTRKVMATITGHHSPQHGKLGIIDPEAGREENEGVTFVAPLRKPKAEVIDSYGQYGEQFQYPCPLNEREFLVSYSPVGYSLPGNILFDIYWMDVDGNRELLFSDKDISSNQPRLVTPRKRPFQRSSTVDYSQTTGTYYLQNVYAGESMKGIAPGSIKKLRIVEIEYRVAGIGSVSNQGKGGAALASSPVGVGNASWDVKKVHGTVDVAPDGSAFFTVPARTPLYFQALDENGYVIQTMRSWSTLQPGEFQSCVGCHEHKNTVPLAQHPVSQAMKHGVQTITPHPGGVRGFSFIKEVQPILNKHCISCHNGEKQKMNLTGDLSILDKRAERAFSPAYISLTKARNTEGERGGWQGTPDNPEVNWISCMSEPSLLPPCSGGSIKSKLISRLKNGHGKTKLTPGEIATIMLWIDLTVPFIGDYREANTWTDSQKAIYDKYERKKQQFLQEEQEAIQQYQKNLLQPSSATTDQQ